MDERLVQFDEKMQKTMNNLSEEFGSIRAGRANPHVLDKLRVDYYGTPTPIQQVANVNVPEPRMIQIQPWPLQYYFLHLIRTHTSASCFPCT